MTRCWSEGDSNCRSHPTKLGLLALDLETATALGPPASAGCPVEKDLLQTLSVIGNEFLLTLVREATAKLDDDLERMLRNPTAARLSDAGAFRALCTE